MTNRSGDRLLEEAAVADFLSVTQTALQRWRRERRGPPFIRIEGAIRYSAAALNAWLAARTVAPAQNDRHEDRPSASNSDPSDILSSAGTKGDTP